MTELLLICIAGFAAGALNAVAGGGTFLTFPALVYLGIPAVAANATATIAALPGYIGSAWAFRHDIRCQGSLALKAMIIASVFGGLMGAFLLITISDEAFASVVPWLLLAATVLFAIGPVIMKAFRHQGIPAAGPIVSALALVSVSVYGGFFNGGLGIMLLATFGLLSYTDLHAMNGLKNVLAAILSLTSTIAFVIAGLIAWEAAIPMAIAAALGGHAGGFWSRRIVNTALLRAFVVMTGLVMTLMFFLK